VQGPVNALGNFCSRQAEVLRAEGKLILDPHLGQLCLGILEDQACGLCDARNWLLAGV